MTALDELLSFESCIDAKVEKLGIFQTPLNAVLTLAFMIIDCQFHGLRIDQMKSRPVNEFFAAAELSYLLPLLLKCPNTLVGKSVHDLLMALNQKDYTDLNLLFQYAYFCQIMPEVHRGLYTVSGGGTKFVLEHTSNLAAVMEARDVVLTEITLPFYIPPFKNLPDFDQLVAQGANDDITFMYSVVIQFYDHYINHSYEMPLLTNQAFLTATGASYDEFLRFRSAWAAVADFALGMADANARRHKDSKLKINKDKFEKKLLEWIAPRLKSPFIEELINSVANLEKEKFKKLMRFYSINTQTKSSLHGGEGFFPPIISYDDWYQFNPDLLRGMLSSRNVLYVLNRTDSQIFDQLVSSDLEPQLLEAAASILQRIPGIEIVKNHQWGAGEIDLLAFQASNNVALHIQAKATLPPQGARMVKRVEERNREGLKQLATFRALSKEKIDGIISSALGHPVRDVRVLDVLLCRSSIGSHKIWAELGKVSAVNLPLLHTTVDRITSKAMPLTRFANIVNSTLKDLDSLNTGKWQTTTVVLENTQITLPSLELDYKGVNSLRCKWYPG